MVAAEGTDGVEDLVHFPEGFTVHGGVEVVEVLADGLVVEAGDLCVGVEQQLQNGLGVLWRRRLGDVVPEGGGECLQIHQNHRLF